MAEGEMVERVARAICCPDGCRSKNHDLCAGETWEHRARAAIAAMREPTEGMVAAGYSPCEGQEADVWRARIDAALEPGA